MSEKKDSASAVRGKTLLEQAREITVYTPEDRDEIYKILDRLSMETGRLSGIGGRTQMLQRKIFSLESEAKKISAQVNPEKAAQQILQVGDLYKQMQRFQAEADQLRTEYVRIMALADGYNRPAPPQNDTLRLDGSQKTLRAMS